MTHTTRRLFLQQSAATLATLTLRPTHLLAQATDTTLTTPLGKLRGTLADDLRIFRGIPFAQPPVGSRRFLPPLPPQPWKGVRPATVFAPAPWQPKDPGIPHSEDCLYLNVWAPTTPGPHPVFVWIHGGGYTGGRSFAPVFDGSGFAQNGMVLVTVAYRLGVFGFLDLEPLLGPAYADSANNALRDLTASLEWVHHNIEAFGGDPNRVTVGGESAGAKATAALLAIPHAASLFTSAVSESGGGERVNTHDQATAVAHEFASLWRQDHPSSAPGFHDLLTATPASLIATQVRLMDSSQRHFPLRPQVGGTLLPQRPTDLVAASSSSGKRLLIGTNRDESAAFLGPHPAQDPTRKDLGNLSLDAFNEVFAKYKTIYPDMTNEQLRIRATTAEEYWVPSIRLADAFATTGGATWMYRLDYAKTSGPMAGESYHALDNSLVWQKPDAIERTDPVAATVALQMHQAWVAFVHGQPPAAPTLPAWPEYNPNTRPTMILSATPHVEDKPFDAELHLWDKVL
jgi:para-nitrobenzyl esterase